MNISICLLLPTAIILNSVIHQSVSELTLYYCYIKFVYTYAILMVCTQTLYISVNKYIYIYIKNNGEFIKKIRDRGEPETKTELENNGIVEV